MDMSILILSSLLVLGLLFFIIYKLLKEKTIKFTIERQKEYNESLLKAIQEDLLLQKRIENDLLLMKAQLTKTLVRIIVKTKNGVTIIKDFSDTVEDQETVPRIVLARDNANIYIRSITDDDGVVEKGDMIYPSHMVESIQRIVVE